MGSEVVFLCEGPRDEAVLCGLFSRLGIRSCNQELPWKAQRVYRWHDVQRDRRKRRWTQRLLRRCGRPPTRDGYRILTVAFDAWRDQSRPEAILVAVRDRDREEFQGRCATLQWAEQNLGERRFVGACAVECIEAWILVRCSLDGRKVSSPHQLRPEEAKRKVAEVMGQDNREGIYALFSEAYEWNDLVSADGSWETGLANFMTKVASRFSDIEGELLSGAAHDG